MKYALIDQSVKVKSFDKQILGDTIAYVNDTEFDVCPPLFWVECSDDCDPRFFYYDESTQTINPIPQPPVSVEEVPAGE